MNSPDASFLFVVNVVIPILAGLVYFGMAKYVSFIAPMRTLVTGSTTYKGAYWGFLFFGVYLASRPLQILLGPHPMPLIVNGIREFLMIGLFAPAVFVAMMSLCFGAERLSRRFTTGFFLAGIVLAGVFLAANAYAIGRSAPLFQWGPVTAHDGLWHAAPDAAGKMSMRVLVLIRLIDPVLLLLAAGGIVFWHAWHYPESKRIFYDNMPIKLYILSAAVFCFALSMLAVTAVTGLGHRPNEWWIHYVGALVAGLLELLSLSLPVRKDVQVSEHI